LLFIRFQSSREEEEEDTKHKRNQEVRLSQKEKETSPPLKE